MRSVPDAPTGVNRSVCDLGHCGSVGKLTVRGRRELLSGPRRGAAGAAKCSLDVPIGWHAHRLRRGTMSRQEAQQGRRMGGIEFHHPAAFWFGAAAVTIGVLLMLPMYIGASDRA